MQRENTQRRDRFLIKSWKRDCRETREYRESLKKWMESPLLIAKNKNLSFYAWEESGKVCYLRTDGNLVACDGITVGEVGNG